MNGLLRFGSVCSGIEAASVAWHPLGWKAAWLSEIEPFPCAILKHHYPDVPNYGDMTLLPARIASGEVEAPDLFCGGTPCQAFSVAGLRNSLDDARGNLSLTFCEIANAIDNRRFVRGKSPSIVFWENVPGVLNTKDNAFGCFLGALAGEDDALIPPGGRWSNAGFIDGPQRAVAWRVLDAQYFGVAQRRKRVFVVASARDDFDPASVLFEFEGVRRDIAPGRKARKVTPTISSSGTGVSRVGFNCEDEWFIETPIAARMVAFGKYSIDGTASAMKARDYKDATDLVAQPVTVYENHPTDSRVKELGDVSSTVRARWGTGGGNLPMVSQPIPIHDQATRHAGKNGEKTMGKGNGLGIGQPGNPMNTLTKGDRHAVAQPIAFEPGKLKRLGYGHAEPGLAYALRAEAGDNQVAIATPMAVRRLTPTECERLQGFPDGYTNIPWRKASESPDGPRYKALGNSWAVPVVRWIGERIARGT